MILADDTLAKVLTDLKYMPVQKLETAQSFAKSEQCSLHDALVRHDYLSEDELGKVAAYYFKLPYVALGKINIPEELLNVVPEDVAKQFQTIAFQLVDNDLHIATAQPQATDLFEMLAKKVGAAKCHVSYATDIGITSALHLFKRGLQPVINDLVNQIETGSVPIAELVDNIFDYAYDAMASDVHIEPLREQTVVRFRIDGVLHDEAYFPKKLHEQIVARLKVLARLRTDEHLSAQDGRMRVMVHKNELTIRVSVVPVVAGEKVVMRLLARQTRQFSLSDLGMSHDDLALVRDGFTRPFGMILSTGPTGSGKTTTIYAILKILNTRDRNIATIEDPVEYELEGTNQIQANVRTNLTFDEGLRSLLRQDPDILFVGEIRDAETAAITVNAAMTGHLVLSTMHTNDAVTTLPRLVDMGIEPYLVASTVNIIVGQRLVRQICNHCKASLKLTRTSKGWEGDAQQATLLTNLSKATFVKHFGNKLAVRVYRGNGCSACHDTGYQGRIGIFEVLEITPKLAQLISAKADSETLIAQAIKDGMTTMLDDGLEKVITGETTLSEIMRVTKI
jgi:type II secretory ATPase GspE/PulE/Tfp pilus assembly ATPase PilB-like protein